MISVLFAAPLAIAKHQLDHYQSAQPIEQCHFCAQPQSLDSNAVSAVAVHALSIINLGKQTNDLDTHSQNDQANHFLSRAPPL